MNKAFASIYTHNKTRSSLFGTKNTEKTMTQQSDAQDCDINVIVKRHTINQLPQVITQPLYGDFTEVLDYRGMMDRIRETQAAFHTIPAEIRKRFQNDPQQFIDFATNKDNLEELRKMGLAPPAPTPPIPPEPMLVRIAPEPATTPK